MCQQTLNQHTCTHRTHGFLATCATPSAPGHQRTTSNIPYPGPCPSCLSGRPQSVSNPPPSYRLATIHSSAPPPAYSTLPPTLYATPQPPAHQLQSNHYYPQYQYQYLAHTCPTYTYFQPSSAIQYPTYPYLFYYQSYPTLSTIPTSQTSSQYYNFQTTPPFPPFPPGQVPSWVPRETRYELIRGVLTPVEHFAAPLAHMPQTGRGWNLVHGFDGGALPPGVGSLARGLSHVTVSSAGGNVRVNDGGGTGGIGCQIGGGSANEVGSEVVEVGSKAGGSETGGDDRRVSFREPLDEQGAEGPGLSREERARDIGAAQSTGEEAGISNAPQVPPGEPSASILVPKSASAARSRGSAREVNGRIGRSEMDRNLRLVEGADSAASGTGSEDQVTDGGQRRREV